MNKIVLFVFIFMVVVVVSGCTGEKTETGVKTEEPETEVKTEESTVKITGTAGEKSDDWCPEGGDWKMESIEDTEGVTTATWKIDKLEKSGKYAGLCHVIYTAKTLAGEKKVDYWFNESKESGFIEMELEGKMIKKKWG